MSLLLETLIFNSMALVGNVSSSNPDEKEKQNMYLSYGEVLKYVQNEDLKCIILLYGQHTHDNDISTC